MSTIRDVAKRACVSTATVSRVINGGANVSPETQRQVQAIIHELDYRPNMLGRNLRCSQTHMVLVLLPDISNVFYAKIVQGMQETLRKYGYQLLLCNTDSNQDIEEQYLRLLDNKLADALIWMDVTAQKSVVDEIATRFPTVFCPRCMASEHASVSIDNEQAAFDAVTHLIDQGYRRIGFLNSAQKYYYAEQRLIGYKRALAAHHLAFDERLVAYVGFDPDKVEFSYRQMTQMADPADSLFAISDLLLQRIYELLESERKKPGKDIGLVGFDDLDLSRLLRPSLTTVHQPRYQLGKTAAEMLIKLMQRPEQKLQPVILPHRLCIRDSSLKNVVGDDEALLRKLR